jgi:hypothetical protein
MLNDPAQVLEFRVNTPSQSLMVTAAQLIYKRFEYNNLGEYQQGGVYACGGD